jgi:hypothetical protein
VVLRGEKFFQKVWWGIFKRGAKKILKTKINKEEVKNVFKNVIGKFLGG